MCIFNNKANTVKPSNTTLLGGRFPSSKGLTHYLGYFNTVEIVTGQGETPAVNEDDLYLRIEKAFNAGVDPLAGLQEDGPISRQSRTTGGDRPFGYHANTTPAPLTLGNAMLIPVPVALAASGKLDDRNINLIPMGRHADFIHDYVDALELEDWNANSKGLLSLEVTRSSREAKVIKGFDDGLYDVVIAESASLITSVIDQVDSRKRPVINSELYAQLDLLYPNWVWLLFCFDQADSGKAGGALVTYTSQYPDLIILPGLDGHSGEVETGNVAVDHTLILGSNSPIGASVRHQNQWMREKAPWLPGSVIGSNFKTMMPQGDFVFLAEEVEAGIFNCLRDLPPGWAQVYGENSIPAPQYYGDSMRRWSKPAGR